MRITALLGAVAALAIATPSVAAVSIGNTGSGSWLVKSNGDTLPGNYNGLVNGSQTASVVANPVWFGNTGTSSWVSTSTTGNANPGYYTYSTTFSSTGNNQVLNFLYAVDDKITAVYLDGVAITVSGSSSVSYDKFYNGSLTVAAPSQTHTLAFVTSNNFPGQNNGINPAGFRFQVAAVPEPATWGMMLLGFGMVGAASRYRRRGAKVTFA